MTFRTSYIRPTYSDDPKLLKKRINQPKAGYSTVRLLDYLEERQKLHNNNSPRYMFGKHSKTPWYSNNFIDRKSELTPNTPNTPNKTDKEEIHYIVRQPQKTNTEWFEVYVNGLREDNVLAEIIGGHDELNNKTKKELDHLNYQRKLHLKENELKKRPQTSKSDIVLYPGGTPPKSREATKAVITPVLDFDGFSDKQIFSPFNFNWSVRPRLSSKK